MNRLPLFPIAAADTIFAQIQAAFGVHESHREPSVEFKRPGPSPWRHAQEWAQLAVDRPDGAPLPEYVAEYDPEPPTDHISFALGVALGRFGPDGQGILDPDRDDLSHALPSGLLFLDGTLDAEDRRDGLGHPACASLIAAWEEHGPSIATKRAGLREYLALDFFKDVHRTIYENRPIHWPLSSEKRTFVAWVHIHRMNGQTLRVLLADHLNPTLTRLDGELADLRAARDGADKKAARAAERQYDRVLKAKGELAAFIASVAQCADRGAPPPSGKGAKCPPREVDARYVPDLDDGVMINSAGLWPLLAPQWKDPKKWWQELSAPKGRKDYDWSHLAMRYWPTRVDTKCQADPSLGVAHGCFWRYHPARAWAWELRLQDEIAPDFRITEPAYEPWADVGSVFGVCAWGEAAWGGKSTGDQGDSPHRDAWLKDDAPAALAAVETEALRRMGRGKKKQHVSELRILEPGLWSTLPAEVWALELRLTEKQGIEFRLLSPDEPPARAAFIAENPTEVARRSATLAGLAERAAQTALGLDGLDAEREDVEGVDVDRDRDREN